MTGKTAVMEQAYAATRRGGTVCIIGIGSYTESFPLNACAFSSDAKTVVGCMYGNANFKKKKKKKKKVDMPNLLELYMATRLDLDAMISRTYPIDEVPQAFEDLQAGRNARGVILF